MHLWVHVIFRVSWNKKKLFDYLTEFAKLGNFFGKMWQIFLFLWLNLAIFVAKFEISNGNFPRCQVNTVSAVIKQCGNNNNYPHFLY